MAQIQRIMYHQGVQHSHCKSLPEIKVTIIKFQLHQLTIFVRLFNVRQSQYQALWQSYYKYKELLNSSRNHKNKSDNTCI